MTTTRRRKTAVGEPVMCPFTVLVDTREQLPYSLRGFQADCRAYGQSRVKGGEDLVVMSRRATLATGDYTVEGLEGVCAVERKSLSDFYLCCGHERERFEAELERLAKLQWAAVVIEATLEEIACEPPPLSQLLSKAAYRSVVTWSVRYCQVIPAGPRELAEVTVFRLLERCWKEYANTEEHP